MLFAKPITFVLHMYIQTYICIYGASVVTQLVKNLPAMQETMVGFLGHEDPLAKG